MPGATPEPRLSEPRLLKRREWGFLQRELNYWKEKRLIDAEQASTIEALYLPAKGHFAQVLFSLGALLIGLGLLSFIAANWDEIPKLLRVGIILAGYVGSILAAWRLEAVQPRLSRACLFLGSFIYGGGVFLIAQMFHEGGHWSGAVLWWFLGLLPVLFLFRDALQLFLCQVLAFIYLNGFYFGLKGLDRAIFWSRSTSLSSGECLARLFVPIWPLFSVLALWVAWRRLEDDRNWNFGPSVFLSLNYVFIGALNCSQNLAASSLLMVGLGALLASFSFGPRKDSLREWGVRLSGVFGLLLANAWAWDGFIHTSPFLPTVFERISALGFSPPEVFAVASSLLICLLMLARIASGSFSAVVFFCLFVLYYYFNSFYSFMPKALAFTVSGLLLVGMGLWVQRLRRGRAARKDGEPE